MQAGGNATGRASWGLKPWTLKMALTSFFLSYLIELWYKFGILLSSLLIPPLLGGVGCVCDLSPWVPGSCHHGPCSGWADETQTVGAKHLPAFCQELCSCSLLVSCAQEAQRPWVFGGCRYLLGSSAWETLHPWGARRVQVRVALKCTLWLSCPPVFLQGPGLASRNLPGACRPLGGLTSLFVFCGQSQLLSWKCGSH